jgi:hypothetical protein
VSLIALTSMVKDKKAVTLDAWLTSLDSNLRLAVKRSWLDASTALTERTIDAMSEDLGLDRQVIARAAARDGVEIARGFAKRGAHMKRSRKLRLPEPCAVGSLYTDPNDGSAWRVAFVTPEKDTDGLHVIRLKRIAP